MSGVTTGKVPAPVLRFSDGAVVRPSVCPRGIQARPHWQITGHPDEQGVNTVCGCPVAS